MNGTSDTESADGTMVNGDTADGSQENGNEAEDTEPRAADGAVDGAADGEDESGDGGQKETTDKDNTTIGELERVYHLHYVRKQYPGDQCMTYK